MSRVRSRVAAHAKHKKILQLSEGHSGKRRSNYKLAHESVIHALKYATEHRRDKKGDFRRLWISRINAAARQEGMSYSRFIAGLRRAGVELDRKVLADIAVREPETFRSLVETARSAA